MFELSERRTFLVTAALFEGGLALFAVALGWFVGIDPIAPISPEPAAVAWGVAATFPLFLLFMATFRRPIGPLRRIKELLLGVLGPPLSSCRWHELVALSLLVGFSEELLFRGVLQPWLSRWGLAFGLVASNILFGLAHFVTALYALIAAVLGIVLGCLLHWPAEGNLLAPIVTHALYDYLAFLMVIREFRRSEANPAEGEDPVE